MKLKISSLLAFSALVVFCLAVATSCKKSNSSAPTNAAFSAMIDNSAFNPTTSNAVYTSFAQSWDIYGFYVKGKDSSVFDVTIFAPVTLNTPVTTYYSGVDYYSAGVDDFSDFVGTGKATITVTSLDSVNHKISGTFSGVLPGTTGSDDSVVVTNGKFNISYLVQ
jgi:hypothetical protein